MKIQKLIVKTILLASVIVGLAGYRYFPFSDYPMFAYIRTDLTTYAIMIVEQDSTETLMPSMSTFPFFRLHINQMIASSLQRTPTDLNWISAFREKAKRIKPNAVALAVRKIKFQIDSEGHMSLTPIIVNKIFELRL